MTPGGARAGVTDVSVPYGAMLNDAFRRVRAVTPHQRLLEEGLKRSVTFGDWSPRSTPATIVYIQRVDRLAPTVAGQLMIVLVPNAQRYLRIQVLDHL